MENIQLCVKSWKTIKTIFLNISKQNTHFQEAIPPKQKLAVCLK